MCALGRQLTCTGRRVSGSIEESLRFGETWFLFRFVGWRFDIWKVHLKFCRRLRVYIWRPATASATMQLVVAAPDSLRRFQFTPTQATGPQNCARSETGRGCKIASFQFASRTCEADPATASECRYLSAVASGTVVGQLTSII